MTQTGRPRDRGRKPKAAFSAHPQVLADMRAIHHPTLPRSPDLLRKIVTALLNHISHKRPHDAEVLRFLVSGVAWLEPERERIFDKEKQALRRDESPTGMPLLGGFTFALREVLKTMASERLPRKGHHIQMLRIQDALLRQFLQQHPPTVKNQQSHRFAPSDLNRWLAKWGPQLLNELAKIPCFHSYNTARERFRFEDAEWTNTLPQVRWKMLSTLHGTTPRHIKKLLTAPTGMVFSTSRSK